MSEDRQFDKQETPRTDEEVALAKKYPGTAHGLWVSAEFTRQLERELRAANAEWGDAMQRLGEALSARVLSAERAQELWPQAGTFHCACIFNRAEDFGEATLVTACAYHSKLRAHDWQPDGGKVTWESHPGGEAAHVHTTCSKCGARAWFLEFHWELLSKGCDAKSSYVNCPAPKESK